MVQVDLKGLATVTAKGRTYYYAWRGGPRVFGEPGSPEFVKSFLAAREGLAQPDATSLLSVIVAYHAGPFQQLAPTTRRTWSPWMDRIRTDFGGLPKRLANHPDKIRPLIRDWRNQFAGTPRAADNGLQVLSVIFSYGVDQGELLSNPCIGMKRLYSSDRSDIIWTDVEIARLKKHCSPEVGWAVDLAAHTGLRQGDLVRLTWSDIKGNEIVVRTSKTGAEAHIPIYADLKKVLKSIPKRSPVILTNSREMPWGNDGHHLRKPFGAAKVAAKLQRLHFHDLRGTAATKFYIADLPIRVIAEIMGWDEDSVTKIIRKYVGRRAATDAIIRQMDRARLQNSSKTAR